MKNLLNAVVENNDLKPKQKAQALLELRNLLDREEKLVVIEELSGEYIDLDYKDKMSLNKENLNLVNRAIGKIKL